MFEKTHLVSACAALLAGLSLAVPAAAELVVLEEALEVDTLDIRLTSDRTGRIVVELCAGCKPESLIITVHSVAFSGGERIPMRDLVTYAERGASVFYDKATRSVTRVEVWQ